MSYPVRPSEMPTRMFTLYGYNNNPRTRLVQITAFAENIDLNLFEVIPRMNLNKDYFLAKFPLSKGKIPALEGPDIKLTETLAITTYLAKLSNKSKLLGDGSLEHEASVISWMSWANQELLATLAEWFLPLIPKFTDPAPYNSVSIANGRSASLRVLKILENFLKDKTVLVGNSISLADVFVAIVVSRGLEWVLGAKWRLEHPEIMRHFEMVANWKPVKSVISEFILIEEETPNEDPQKRL